MAELNREREILSPLPPPFLHHLHVHEPCQNIIDWMCQCVCMCVCVILNCVCLYVCVCACVRAGRASTESRLTAVSWLLLSNGVCVLHDADVSLLLPSLWGGGATELQPRGIRLSLVHRYTHTHTHTHAHMINDVASLKSLLIMGMAQSATWLHAPC